MNQKTISCFHPVSLLVTFFCVGKMPFTPGTWGSLPAFPLAFLVFFTTGSHGYWILPALILGLMALGTYAIHLYITKTGKHDPKEVVVDEVVGQLITIYAAAPIMGRMPDHGGLQGYALLFACFVLFRLFDIIKPWPVGWADRDVPGAIGVMLDDVLAGILAGAVVYFGAIGLNTMGWITL